MRGSFHSLLPFLSTSQEARGWPRSTAFVRAAILSWSLWSDGFIYNCPVNAKYFTQIFLYLSGVFTVSAWIYRRCHLAFRRARSPKGERMTASPNSTRVTAANEVCRDVAGRYRKCPAVGIVHCFYGPALGAVR